MAGSVNHGRGSVRAVPDSAARYVRGCYLSLCPAVACVPNEWIIVDRLFLLRLSVQRRPSADVS